MHIFCYLLYYINKLDTHISLQYIYIVFKMINMYKILYFINKIIKIIYKHTQIQILSYTRILKHLVQIPDTV